ncbi:Hypothetical protein FKW44_011455 [Caligus rogercresseyi]|uniref:Uncharacterized protein n=1 Tax=Caligus rogercresseyi TaxID=217165 RepID=A0A7T8HI18_CALRO|nr:Hypothetical protein FKW44_011455 [Caligus rogercresseyi]
MNPEDPRGNVQTSAQKRDPWMTRLHSARKFLKEEHAHRAYLFAEYSKHVKG